MIKTITDTTETEEHGSLVVLKDPYKFATQVQYAQDVFAYENQHTILFNKGRYFETTILNKILREQVSQESDTNIQFENMVVGNWRRLEAFVKAMNKHGWYVKINIDWI